MRKYCCIIGVWVKPLISLRFLSNGRWLRLPLCAMFRRWRLYVDQQVPLRRIPASDWPGAGGESALRKWTSQPPASEVLARTYNAHIRCASHANPPKHDVPTAREEGGQRVDLGGRAGGCPQSRDQFVGDAGVRSRRSAAAAAAQGMAGNER